MNVEEDTDSINDRLYSLYVPNESIKQIMFYFTVLKETIDFQIPENYYNFDQPYFINYSEMEEFLSFAIAFNPIFLNQHNLIIFNNQKNFYKYYRFNNDLNGMPYEFKIIDMNESLNFIFTNNDNNPRSINNKNIDINFIVNFSTKNIA